MHARNLTDDIHTLKGKELEKKKDLSARNLNKKKVSRSLLLEPVGTAEIGENAHRVALMLLYAGKQM